MRITKRIAARVACGATVALVAMPGVAAAACPAEPTTQPFSYLGDDGHYFLAPGGDFEGALTWARTGSATVVPSGSNGVDSGVSALSLPQNSSATSPAICVDADRPHLRLAARALSANGTLRLDAIDDAGNKTLLAKFDASGHVSWRVTNEVLLAAPLGLTDPHTKQVKLRLTALNGEWLADAVYVDPYTRG